MKTGKKKKPGMLKERDDTEEVGKTGPTGKEN